MKWRGRQGSSNVDDRRGGGGGRRVARGGKRMGIMGVIIFMILGYVFRDSPMMQQFLGAAQQQMNQGGTTYVETPREGRADDELAQFVSVVLKETEDCWTKIFREEFGTAYQKPVLVLYDREVSSACGHATSATGPFYCPGDQKLYIDLSFYQELSEKFGASGDFAMAYVVAHEVAHHIQYLRGITRQVDSQRGRISKEAYNNLSVRLELQADFLSGVWAKYVQGKGLLEAGDVEEALRCANAIGDDRLQMQARGYVVPESFTHGTSAQRMKWFKKGLQTGDVNQGNTFSTQNL